MLFTGIESAIAWLQGLPPEFVWGLLIITCFSSVLILTRLLGEFGLYSYIIVAIIAANIQVLKATQFSLSSTPIALGTILFTSTFLCTDILAEYYGKKAAQRGVYLGFAAMTLMTLFMILGLGFQPLDPTTHPTFSWATENHNHMLALFTPTPALLIAGMTAYLISQLHDVWLFTLIKKWTHKRSLWLRNNVSTIISSFIDNVIFSILAWKVLAYRPLDWHTIIFTYILGTYLLRLIVAILDTPIIYLAKFCIKPHIKSIPNKEEAINTSVCTD